MLTTLSAVGAHLGAHPRWEVAANFIIMTNGKRGHQLFDASLAKGTFHVGIMAHHELIKFVAAMFAVIFIDRHGFPPY